MLKTSTSYKNLLGFVLLLFGSIWINFSVNGQCANGNLISKGYFIANAKGCAGINQVDLTIKYANLESNAIINVDWGAGGAVQQFGYTTGNTGPAGAFERTISYIYPKATAFNCIYTIRIWATNTCYPTPDTEQRITNVVVWNTDRNNFGITDNVVRVCQGIGANVTFRDTGPWNCFNSGQVANRNLPARNLQFIYGRGGTNTIAGITVAGVTPSPEIVSAVVSRTAPGGYTSSVINVPATKPNGSNHNVGDRFYLTLNNWNQCNPYPGTPETATAYIEIVAAPNPAFARRKTSMNAAGEDFLDFCPNDNVYLKNLTSNPNGFYNFKWSIVNATNDTIHAATTTDLTYKFGTPGTYTAVLSVVDADAIGNCKVVITKSINIIAAPTVKIEQAGIEATDHNFCKPDRSNPLPVTLNGVIASANPNYSYTWNFYKKNSATATPDSTSTSVSTTLSLSIQRPGLYKIRLTAVDNTTGCSSFTETTIKVFDRPTAAFAANSICSGSKTSFSGISKKDLGIQTIVENDNIVKWEWDFNNDGTIDLTRTDDSSFDYFIAPPFGPSEPSTSVAAVYDTKLIVTTGKGCSHEITKQVTVKQTPAPVFTMNPSSGIICSGQKVDFIDGTPASPAIDSYAWDFGPNASPKTSTSASVSGVLFTNTNGADVNYNVRLTVMSNGCSNYYEVPVTIHPAPPISIFSDFDPTQPNCSPIKPEFLHSADPAIVSKYQWIIKDNTNGTTVKDAITSTNEVPFSPTNVFINNNLTNTNIDYEVQLKVIYLTGCEVSSNKVKITVKPNPLADFTATYVNDCSPKKVAFTPNILDGLYYEWSFQNGHIPDYSSNSPTVPEIIFTNKSSTPQNYNVTLTITSASGCKNTVKKTIFVKPQPDPSFSIVNNRVLCTGDKLEFKNQTPSGASVTKFIWKWGDGTPDTEVLPPATASVFHTFRNDSPDTIASFKVRLITVSECEAFSNQQSILVDPKLVPSFNLMGANCSPAKITVQNKSDGPVNKVNWFINGAPQTIQGDNATFDLLNTSDSEITYKISMRISSLNGCDTTITQSVIVYPQPKPTFTATPELLVLPDKTVTINNTTPGTWDYEWDFGDGSPLVNEKDPAPHTFPDLGIYTIRLTVSKGNCKASTTREVTIYAKKPIADFAPEKVSGCKPVTVSFINKSQYADSTKYEWDFGDGKGKSKEVNPTYTYTEPGEYSVRLLARNFQDLSDDTVRIGAIKVYDIPKANFLARPIYIELPDKPIYCTNQSRGADSYLWDFGDGTFSTETDPAHIYQDTGRFTIKLIAFNKDGCSDTVSIQDAVKAVWNGRILIPNAFTPNPSAFGVGSTESNDYFFPKAEGLTSLDLKIFDRWGELLYRTTNINDKGWNGYYNGSMCKQDVYIYVIKVAFRDGFQMTQTGDVVLIR